LEKDILCCSIEEKKDYIDCILADNSLDSMELVAKLIDLLKDDNYEVREKAAQSIVRAKNNSPVKQLLKAIASDDPNYRNSAAETLILIGEAIIPFLIDELDSDDKDVRKFLVDVMGEIKSEKAVPYLIAAIDDLDENVAEGACESLGKIGSAEAVDALIHALTKGEWLQFSAIEAMGKIGDPKSVPYIINIMQRSSDCIKYVAIEALGNIKDELAVDPILKEINNKNPEIFRTVILSLKNILKNSEILQNERIKVENLEFLSSKLKKIYKTSNDFELKKAILQIVAFFRLEECYETLLIESTSLDQEISDKAIDAALIIGQDLISFIFEILDKMSENPDFELETAMLYLLGEIGIQANEENLRYLQKYLSRSEEELREVCIQTLERIYSIEKLDFLEEYLSDESGNVRKVIMEVFAKHKKLIKWENIFKILNDKYNDVRNSGIDYCVSINSSIINEKIISEIKNNIENLDEKYLEILIKICGKLNISESVELIIESIETHNNLRNSGIEALGTITSKKAVNYLIMRLKDKDVISKKLASDALGKLKSDKAIPELIKLINDDDSWVRFFTINALSKFKNNDIKTNFLRRLENEDSNHVIIEILSGLGQYEIDNNLSPLIYKYVEHEDKDVAGAAILAMKNLISEPEIRSKLLEKLKTNSWKIKSAILEIFEDVDISEAEIIKILPLIKDDNILVKEKAVAITSKYGDYSMVAPIMSTMIEENLGEITFKILAEAKEQNYSEFIRGLYSKSDSIRIFTANALTIIADAYSENDLLNGIKDSNWKVRYFCAEALGNIKSKKSIDSLLRLVDDENKYVMEAALRAIKKIGGQL